MQFSPGNYLLTWTLEANGYSLHHPVVSGYAHTLSKLMIGEARLCAKTFEMVR